MERLSDLVIANDIETMVRIGCSEAERTFPQRLLVTVRTETNTRPVASSLDLSQSICYATVSQMVRELGEGKPWVLCEEFAEAIAASVFERFPPAQAAHVSIKKFILAGVGWTGVEIHRDRP